MFRDNKREIFSFRKYKNGRTDSKLIGATILALGIGLVTTTHTVSADVVNGAGGHEVALVDSADKTTSANTNTFTDNADTTKTAKFDAVLNKGVAEPTKANENKGDADGSDVLTVTSETTVNYKLEEDKSLLKTETVATGQGTITTPYDKKGLAADTDGKDYRESTADKSGITVSEETGKQDTLELNGKVYERTRSEVEGADKAKYSKTQFNDIEASVSPEGMHNKLGEIDYTKTTGKVYLVEETSDGHYGNFVETDGVSSDEDAVSKWKAGLANAKDFTKANVTLQEGDSILVLDKDTYAVGNSKTIKNVKRYNGFTFGLNPNSIQTDNDSSFSNPTFSLSGMPGVTEIVKAGSDGIFGTSDDVVESVNANADAIVDFYTGINYGFSPDLYADNPFFKPSTHTNLSITSTPSELDALKNHSSYAYLNDLIKFAEKEATSESDKAKVAEVKRKFETKLQEGLSAVKSKGYNLVYVKNSDSNSNTGRYVFQAPGVSDPTDLGVDMLDEKLSPSRELSELFNNLTFTNVSESTVESSENHNLDLTTRVEKKYTVGSTGEISMEKTTTITGTFKVTKAELLNHSEAYSNENFETDYADLLKSGNVTVKDDGSVVIKSTEIGPVNHFYNGDSETGTEIFSDTNGFRFPSADNEGLTLGAMTESSHNETIYNKREIITPIRAYKVVADGTSTVTHYYREKKAPLNVNYYLENTTTSLAPSESQADLPVKSDYTTQAKEIPSKTEFQDLPEKTVTTVTTYELVATPDNANGKIAEGGTTVNYFYRAVEKVTEVAKQAPVTVNYYKEGTTEKLADTIEQGQKDIGSNYTTEAKAILDKVEVQDLEDRVITKTTSYELVSEPTDKEGKVPVGGKVVNYFYREVVKEDVVMKQLSSKPNDAPKVDIPEYNEPIGVVPNDAPKVDIPEYNEPIGVVPNDAPKVDIPEYNEPIGVVPNDAPKVDIPEYNEPIGKVPNDAPKVDIPEYNEPIGVVPNDAPKVDIPEYNEPIGVPGTPEIHEKSELVVNEVPNKPVEPSNPVYVENVSPIKENMLPNTGGGDSSILSLLGGLSLTSLLGFVFRKRKED